MTKHDAAAKSAQATRAGSANGGAAKTGAAKAGSGAVLRFPNRAAAPRPGPVWSAADDGFFAARRAGLAAVGGSLWVALAGAVAAAAAAPALQLAPLAAVGVAAGVGAGLYALSNLVLALVMDHALERKVADIRRTARIGCERLRVDDGALMRAAVTDVLGEWMHINFFARRLREETAVVVWAIVAQSALTLAALAAWAALAAPDPWSLASVAPIGAALSLAHAALHARRLRRQAADVTPTVDDPTAVLADRMVALLEEVKDLRKPALRA